MTNLLRLQRFLQQSFDGEPWYGPSVMAVLKEVTPQQATRTLLQSHSILQLVQHMTRWRRFVVAKMEGAGADVTDVENFPAGGRWADAVEELRQSQTELLTALEHFSVVRLSETVPGREYDFAYMLEGIVQHDIYHLGQISLLRKNLPA
ncbi:MAG: DinB family protein [Cyclobacteriaceae bacterium]